MICIDRGIHAQMEQTLAKHRFDNPTQVRDKTFLGILFQNQLQKVIFPQNFLVKILLKFSSAIWMHFKDFPSYRIVMWNIFLIGVRNWKHDTLDLPY